MILLSYRVTQWSWSWWAPQDKKYQKGEEIRWWLLEMDLNKDCSSVWSGKWLGDPASQFSCSFADMKWPSAIMKHQPTQQTTGSIRWPHRHTSFPKGWPRSLQRPCVSEDLQQPVEKDKEMRLQRELAAQPLPSFVFGACCRNLACGRHHATREGCVDVKGQSWFSRAL